MQGITQFTHQKGMNWKAELTLVANYIPRRYTYLQTVAHVSH